jgi:hypothetical protein
MSTNATKQAAPWMPHPAAKPSVDERITAAQVRAMKRLAVSVLILAATYATYDAWVVLAWLGY